MADIVTWHPRRGPNGDDRYRLPPNLQSPGRNLRSGPSDTYSNPPLLSEVNAGSHWNQIIAEARRQGHTWNAVGISPPGLDINYVQEDDWIQWDRVARIVVRNNWIRNIELRPSYSWPPEMADPGAPYGAYKWSYEDVVFHLRKALSRPEVTINVYDAHTCRVGWNIKPCVRTHWNWNDGFMDYSGKEAANDIEGVGSPTKTGVRRRYHINYETASYGLDFSPYEAIFRLRAKAYFSTVCKVRKAYSYLGPNWSGMFLTQTYPGSYLADVSIPGTNEYEAFNVHLTGMGVSPGDYFTIMLLEMYECAYPPSGTTSLHAFDVKVPSSSRWPDLLYWNDDGWGMHSEFMLKLKKPE